MVELNDTRLSSIETNPQALVNDNGLSEKLGNREALNKLNPKSSFNNGKWKFPKHPFNKYSEEYRQEYEKLTQKGITPTFVKKHCCQNCGDIFYTSHSRGSYCSYRCRNDAAIRWRKKRRMILRLNYCKYCKKQFQAMRKDAKFCCDSHRVLAFQKRRA